MPRLFTLVSLLLLFLSSQTLAQSPSKEDVVYLKNGSIIRGEIIERDPEYYIKIQISGGSVLTFVMDEIQSIQQEKPIDLSKKQPQKSRSKKEANHGKRNVSYRTQGVYNLFSFGIGVGESLYENPGWIGANPSFQYSIGYRAAHWFSIGQGIGMDFYDVGSVVPFYVEIRGDLLKRPVTPHFYASGGYSLGAIGAWEISKIQGGLYAHVGAGYKIHTKRRAEWLFSLGYKMQQIKAEKSEYIFGWQPDGYRIERYYFDYRRFMLQVALGF